MDVSSVRVSGPPHRDRCDIAFRLAGRPACNMIEYRGAKVTITGINTVDPLEYARYLTVDAKRVWDEFWPSARQADVAASMPTVT